MNLTHAWHRFERAVQPRIRRLTAKGTLRSASTLSFHRAGLTQHYKRYTWHRGTTHLSRHGAYSELFCHHCPWQTALTSPMAPMPLDEPTSLKRKATTADLDAPVAKKQAVLHHHRFTWLPTEADRHQVAPLDKPSLDAILERTITLALGAVGFAGAQDGIIEAFRVEVEECTGMPFSGTSDCADSHRYAPPFWRRQAVNA